MRRLLRQAVCVLCCASPLAAQTSDPLFARWRWNPDGIGSRPAGMAGAFVAVADSGKAAYVNPAGLTLIPVRELGLSSGQPWLSGAAGTQTFRLAAYATRSRSTRDEWEELSGAPSVARGFLDTSVWEAGLAGGLQPIPRLRLGASIAWSRLELEGEEVRSPAADGQRLVTTVAGGSTEMRLSAGLLLDLVGSRRGSLPSLRLGLGYQPGFDWSADVRHGRDAAGSSVEIRRPSLVALGLSYRPSDRWGFSVQGDYIGYREVVDTLRRNSGAGADGFALTNALEPRLGVEFASPLWCGCGVVKLRGGAHYQSPGTLRYSGPDPALAAAFPSLHWTAVYSLGASFFSEYLGNAVRLDLDSKDLLDGPELSFGIVWRF
jgi:hypothetical protein